MKTMSKPTMKGLPKDFPDVNEKRYWRAEGIDNANPDGFMYDPSHTIFFIRDYMKDVKVWINKYDLTLKVDTDKVDTECDRARCPRYDMGELVNPHASLGHTHYNDCPFCYKQHTCWVKVMVERMMSSKEKSD